MLEGLSQPTTITLSVVGLFAFLALIALLRIVLRGEPSPARWRRFRFGVFVERDPSDERGEVKDADQDHRG